MRLTGLGVWGEPEDRQECVRVVCRAVELGVQLIDTADSYGPSVSEEIIREAIHPCPDDVLIATKAGLTRNGPTCSGPTRGWCASARRRGPRSDARSTCVSRH
ncbi:aldo/keto reductase [Streptomyces sp. NBC_01306]|uniref:aldo/keto reductase n=1 Tax=Streptomyces sp. NBC_01306 TaxID=2903819 RepID=UPI002B1E8570|nr:aldo/keto reductase [Streptomyces sp. NBC_01306]